MIRIFLISCVSLTSILKLILLHFLELEINFLIIYYTQFCQFVLFNNKDILIGGRRIFYRSWLNKNVFLVQDLLGDDGKVLSYSEFFRKFRLNRNFLHYMQVVSVIPKDLIDDAQRYHIDKNRKDYYKSRTLHREVVTNNKKKRWYT